MLLPSWAAAALPSAGHCHKAAGIGVPCRQAGSQHQLTPGHDGRNMHDALHSAAKVGLGSCLQAARCAAQENSWLLTVGRLVPTPGGAVSLAAKVPSTSSCMAGSMQIRSVGAGSNMTSTPASTGTSAHSAVSSLQNALTQQYTRGSAQQLCRSLSPDAVCHQERDSHCLSMQPRTPGTSLARQHSPAGT